VLFETALHATHLGPAYLDGSTGSMMIQAAIAGLLSMGYIAKTRWNHFKAMILAKRKRTPISPQ
jgi:hypothetical protein